MSVPPDEEERRRVNPFDWEVEFAAIMKAGFDAVIGNPPYVSQLGIGEHKDYLVRHYETFVPTADLYVCFIEKALGLTKLGGRFSFIVSNKWMRAAYGAKTREFLTRKYEIKRVVDFGLGVFEGATTRPAVIIVNNTGKGTKSFEYARMPEPKPEYLREQVAKLKSVISTKDFKPNEPWGLASGPQQAALTSISKTGVPLYQYLNGKIYRGVLTGFNKAFVIDEVKRDELVKKDQASGGIIVPFVVGNDVRRYSMDAKSQFLILIKIGTDINRYPAVFEHLKQYQKQLEKRWDKGNYWWELRACSYYEEFEKPRIIFADIAKEPRFAVADAGVYAINTVYMLPTPDPYLLGLLNSSVLWFVITNTAAKLESKTGKPHYRFFKQTVDNLPIRPIDLNEPADVAGHDKMVALVEEMLGLHKRLAAAKSDADKQRLQRAIKTTDGKIDALVYELYGLSAEEIRIVEGG